MPSKTKSELHAENVLRARIHKLEATLFKQSSDKNSKPKHRTVEQKQVQRALQDSETRYRRLFESAKDGILLLDAQTGQITDVNPFLVELLGYSREEFLGKRLWEIGPFKDIQASRAAFRELQEKEYIRYEELPLESKNGAHVQVEFVSNVYRVNGKRVIQCNIRDISERVHTKAQLEQINQELSALVAALQEHDREMQLINRMNDLLQTCKTKEEAYRVVALAAAELFVGQSGVLAVLHPSGRFLETVARWGSEPPMQVVFALDDCWAMRRGQLHAVADPQSSVVCHHFVRPPETGYLCLPLVVQGETLGLLYLETPTGMNTDHAVQMKQLVVTVSEGIKLSLSNLKLREVMDMQATHDALTGLFNRRYLNDTLPRELHRALRNQTSLCIAMLDIDHFKHINDTYGHEAGDLLLRELGRTLRENMRKSDLVCRYGGEEFVLVLPDSPIVASIQHLERIRTQIKELQVRYGGQLLETITLSVGLAQAPEDGLTEDEILRAADKALYSAKRAGRDCIVAYKASS